MQGISVDFKGILPFVSEEEINNIEENVMDAHYKIENRTGSGSNMLRMD